MPVLHGLTTTCRINLYEMTSGSILAREDSNMTGAPLDVTSIRRDFPILQRQVHGRPLVYLDNCVDDPQTAGGHRSSDALLRRRERQRSSAASTASASRRPTPTRRARATVAAFLNAAEPREIVFVRGTTEAINLVAQSYGRSNVGRGRCGRDLGDGTPLQPRAVAGAVRGTGAPSSGSSRPATRASWISTRTERCWTIASGSSSIVHVSNALGTINPVEAIVGLAHGRGIPVLVDGAQAVAHMNVDVRALGCDFYALSGHKMLAPTGIGVLYASAPLLEAMPPYQYGGDMISSVTFERTLYKHAAAQVRGWHAAHRRRRRPRRRDRLSDRESASTASRAPSTSCWSTRVDGLSAIPGPSARSARPARKAAFCRSSSTASTRTMSARFSIAKASRFARDTTAVSR